MKMTLSRPSIEVRFASARYSVPHRLVGRAVELQASDRELTVLFEGLPVAQHPLLGPGECSIEDAAGRQPRRAHRRAPRRRRGLPVPDRRARAGRPERGLGARADTLGQSLEVVFHVDRIPEINGSYRHAAIGSDHDGFIKARAGRLGRNGAAGLVETALVHRYCEDAAEQISSANVLRLAAGLLKGSVRSYFGPPERSGVPGTAGSTARSRPEARPIGDESRALALPPAGSTAEPQRAVRLADRPLKDTGSPPARGRPPRRRHRGSGGRRDGCR
jgi:hypothetical protein